MNTEVNHEIVMLSILALCGVKGGNITFKAGIACRDPEVADSGHMSSNGWTWTQRNSSSAAILSRGILTKGGRVTVLQPDGQIVRYYGGAQGSPS